MRGRWLCILAVTSLLNEVAYAQVATVALEVDRDTVTEGMAVEVCLTLINRENLSGSATVTLTTDDIQSTAGEDYIDLREDFTFTSSSPDQQCLNLTTLRDNVVEDSEGLLIVLVNNTNINVGPARHVTIMPADDSIEVDFVMTEFTVSESDLELQNVCVFIVSGAVEGAGRSVEVNLMTTDITTFDQQDYSDPSPLLFETGDSEGDVKCSVIDIRDDTRVEGDEMFLVSIVNDSSTQPVVTFGGPAGVTILDNDRAVVDFTNSSVTVTEGDTVNICVQLDIDPTTPLGRDVLVTFNPQDVNTTRSSDYSLPQTQLNFSRGSPSETILCAEVVLTDDEVEEEKEVFNIQLVPMAPDITAGNTNRLISITILDEDINCDALSPPDFAVLDTPMFAIEGAIATYTCQEGSVLQGNATRTCVNGTWTGSEPVCAPVDCGGPPMLSNGRVTVDSTTFQSTANYSCDSGYQLAGEISSRVCQADRMWSDENIQCTTESDSEASRLSGGAIAGIVIAILIIAAVVAAVVVLLILIYAIPQRNISPRSGKYSLNNKGIEDWREPEGTGTVPRPAKYGIGEQRNIELGQHLSEPEDYEEEYLGPTLTYPIDDV